jgi:hypothetical protein
VPESRHRLLSSCAADWASQNHVDPEELVCLRPWGVLFDEVAARRKLSRELGELQLLALA